jgi:hypothetical protein
MEHEQIAEIIGFFWAMGLTGYAIRIFLIAVKKPVDG